MEKLAQLFFVFMFATALFVSGIGMLLVSSGNGRSPGVGLYIVAGLLMLGGAAWMAYTVYEAWLWHKERRGEPRKWKPSRRQRRADRVAARQQRERVKGHTTVHKCPACGEQSLIKQNDEHGYGECQCKSCGYHPKFSFKYGFYRCPDCGKDAVIEGGGTGRCLICNHHYFTD